jgi:antitoxin VapB
MKNIAKVFQTGRSQALRLPKAFRVRGTEVRLSRVPGGILIREGDPWEQFDGACRELEPAFFRAMEQRERRRPQKRDFGRLPA